MRSFRSAFNRETPVLLPRAGAARPLPVRGFRFWHSRIRHASFPAVQVPPWLTFLIAGVVAVFGVYRLRIAMRSRADEAKAGERGGLYGLPRRTHFLFGILYLLLSLFLIAAGLGWIRSPFASAPSEPEPTTIELAPAESAPKSVEYAPGPGH